MNNIQVIADYIIEQSYDLAQRMNEEYDKEFVFSQMQREEVIELNQWRAQFIEYLGEAAKDGSYEGVWEKASEWARQSGEAAVARGIGLDEAMTTLTSWRTVLWTSIQQKLNDVPLTANDVIEMGLVINPVIDHASQIFSLAYVKSYQESIEKSQSSVLEYSVPVVGLSNDVAILPLIGELDDERARILKEVALHKCLELRNSTLILDLSGVPMVDTMVANELSQVIDSLKLIGVKTVLTGLRPEIAQAVIEIGIKFEGMTIKKNLKSAIEELQSTKTF
ncbi:STAS domain-containing protein [Jeotgalibacillus proteolyticus]|uniref:Anti-anti-sigma factor n=1 Tax=Jeotgalibacillus proteolyticus TaxID=2082395 RepID=A0A2S5GCQ5_9BACL|nr:STAS domain-containing protein [Jeotgalibacillus proteolyticus]PPA70701.1 anti-anti-sigma factor [Jeotgalibacillus proteolyticus]